MKKYPIVIENISDKGNFVVKQHNVPLQSGALVNENSEIEIIMNPIEGYDGKLFLNGSETQSSNIIVNEPIYLFSNDVTAPIPGEPIPVPTPVQPKLFINSSNTVKEDTNFDVELNVFPADYKDEICLIHGHVSVIGGTKLNIAGKEITIENNGEFIVGPTEGMKLSEFGNQLILTCIAIVGDFNIKFELLKKSDLTIFSSVEKTISVIKNDQKILPELVVNIPQEIVFKEEFDFNVETIPNDDEFEMVLVKGILSGVPDAHTKVNVKYREQNGEYLPLPYETDGSFIFGPRPAGFPLHDIVSYFKATINETGDYNMRLELYKVSDNEILAVKDVAFKCKYAGGGDEPQPTEKFIEEFKNLTLYDANYSWIISSQYFSDGMTLDNIRKFYVEYFKYYMCRDKTDYIVKDLCEKQFGTIEHAEENIV